MFGVLMRGLPSAAMVSARWSSEKISKTFGLLSEAVCSDDEQAAVPRTNESNEARKNFAME